MMTEYMNPTRQILYGDCRETLKQIPDKSVQCCITSPPYYGLRSYIPDEHPMKPFEIGQEKSPSEFVKTMVKVFMEVHRILKDDGVLWINLGDSYAASRSYQVTDNKNKRVGAHNNNGRCTPPEGYKQKDLIGIPWLVAFALRETGWYLRCDIIWAKGNPMPESVRDRPTKAHEYIFLMSKRSKYYYDAKAIREPVSESMLQQIEEGYNGEATKDFFEHKAQDASGTKSRIIAGKRKILKEMRTPTGWDTSKGECGHGNFHKNGRDKQSGHGRRYDGFNDRWDKMTREEQMALGANKRSVWTVHTQGFKGSHFATFPPDLIRPCVLAGTKPGDTILDPFIGSGTTGEVALEYGRNIIGCELYEANSEFIETRTQQPGLAL